MHKVARNILSLMVGNVGAQLVALAALPLLSRLYGPETFGVFGSLFALINVLAILYSMRMELTVIECGVDQKRIAELATYFFISLMAIAVSPIVMVGVMEFYGVSFVYAVLCIWAAVVIALFQVAVACGIASSKYKILGVANVVRAVVLACAQLMLFYVFGDSVLPLLIALIISTMVGFFVSRSGFKDGLSKIIASRRLLLKFIADNVRTPKYAGTQALINSLSQSIPYIVLPIFFPIAIVGLYYFADKVFRLPLTLIGQPIRQVFLGYCNNKEIGGQQLRNVFYALTLGCLFFSVCIAAILFSYGPYVFDLVFGAAYADAGIIAAWLGVWGVGAFISFPSLSLLRSFNANDFILKTEIAWSFLKFGSLFFAGYFSSDMYQAIQIFSIVSALYGLVLFIKASMLIRPSRSVRSWFM